MQAVKNKVQYLAIEKLKPHKDNPRFIKDEAFKTLCESIAVNPEYFETRPIICDKEFTIWAGNMRYRGAKHIGLKFVPTVVLDLPEDKMREIMVRDNVQNGEWDAGLLSSLFKDKELTDWGVDLSQFGVDTDEEAPDKLTSSTKADKKPTIKISFDSTDDLEKAKEVIEEVISIYKGATLSVSAGEL